MKLSKLNTPLAFFLGIVVVFLYLAFSPASALLSTINTSLLSALFKYGLTVDTAFVVFLRSILIFSGVFSLIWLFLELRSGRNN